MNIPFVKTHQNFVDHEIERLFEDLDAYEVGDDEYQKITELIIKYYNVKKEQEAFKHDITIKSIAIGGTLASIGAIMIFEKANVIGTKAFGFIPKINFA